MSIASIVVINHFSDLGGVVPEIAEPSRKVVWFQIILVKFVAQPSGEKCEELANVLAVRVYKSIGRNSTELYACKITANPAAGKAIKLFSLSACEIAYLNFSSCPFLDAHSSKRESTNSIRYSLMGSVLILPEPSRMMGLPPKLNIDKYNNKTTKLCFAIM